MRSIFIPKSATSVGDSFYKCGNLVFYLERALIPEGWSEKWNTLNRPVYFGVEEVLEANGIEYLLIDGSITIARYLGEDYEFEIPTSIDGFPVISIEKRAFENCNLSLFRKVL